MHFSRKTEHMNRSSFIFSAILILVCQVLTSCHVARYFYFNYADINDHRKFAALPVKASDQVFWFHQSDSFQNSHVAKVFKKELKDKTLTEILKESQTVSFIIIRNDTLLSELYFDQYNRASIVPVFSIAKSFMSALAGIAIDKGYFESIDDTIGKYFPELRGKGFEELKLIHLLDMRSGIAFQESYKSPFSDMAKYYYGTNLSKYIRDLEPETKPDSEYKYVSVNTLLLSMAIEQASGKKLTDLLQETLWQPLGMEFDASWSVDSPRNNTLKSFCCLNTTAIDLARFARLYLYQGMPDGKLVVDTSWISKTMTLRNNSIDSQGYPYGLFWRVNTNGAIFAKGILGQFIYIDPGKDLIFVRLGKSSGGVNWPALFEEISEIL